MGPLPATRRGNYVVTSHQTRGVSVRISRSRSYAWLATGVIATLASTALSLPTAQADPTTAESKLTLAETQPRLAGKVAGDKAASSGLAETSPGLRAITSAKKIPVLIKFDYDAVASYTGGINGYAATSPSVTDRELSANAAAVKKYEGYVRSRETTIGDAVRRAVPAASINRSFRTVYGGVAAVVPGNAVKDILKVPGVVAVQRDTLNHPLTDSSIDFINAPAAYRALRTRANAGKNMVLGNLDSGVWPEHPSFADQGNLPDYTGPAVPCEFGDNPLTEADDPFTCQNKLIGGRTFLDTYALAQGEYMYPDTARDPGGHGTHTASTSAGNIVNDAQTVGPLLDIQGVAPGARIIEYRVCGGPAGCYGSDSTAAVEQAVLDGVDVINFSISGGTSPLTDPVELAFLDAYNAGIFVATSGGNDGPGAGTVNHLSPWTTTVAASTQTREFASDVTLTADNGDSLTMSGATITAGAGPAPVVMAADAPYSDELCQTPAEAGAFAGAIVVCRRGVNARVEKGYNVLQGGAEGMILYNGTLQDTETDNHWLPVVHLPEPGDLLTFMASHTGVTATWAAGAGRDGQGDVMAGFSSRGPAGNFIKPDITAPGVQIAAGMTPTPEVITDGPEGEYYQVIAGTSMSSPHVAGVALLLKSLHPDWDPGQIKSAMMTRAVTKVVKEDLSTPADPFDMGAGRVNVGRAMQAPLTISDNAANFAALAGDEVNAVHLNIPSINAPGDAGPTHDDADVEERHRTHAVRPDLGQDQQWVDHPGFAAALLDRSGCLAHRGDHDHLGRAGRRAAVRAAHLRHLDCQSQPACRLCRPAGRRVAHAELRTVEYRQGKQHSVHGHCYEQQLQRTSSELPNHGEQQPAHHRCDWGDRRQRCSNRERHSGGCRAGRSVHGCRQFAGGRIPQLGRLRDRPGGGWR